MNRFPRKGDRRPPESPLHYAPAIKVIKGQRWYPILLSPYWCSVTPSIRTLGIYNPESS